MSIASGPVLQWATTSAPFNFEVLRELTIGPYILEPFYTSLCMPMQQIWYVQTRNPQTLNIGRERNRKGAQEMKYLSQLGHILSGPVPWWF